MREESFKPRGWDEGRRLRAWELKQQGWKQADIAQALGVRQETVSRWMKRVRAGGVSALKTRARSGRPRKLSEAQLARIPELLVQGAQAHGFRDEVWTTRRVARLIRRHFGVRYHPDHVSRVLRHQLGWTPQKPELRASQRDEEAIEAWQRERWPELKKRPSGKDARSCG